MHNLKFIVPYIPIIGIFIIFFAPLNSWVFRDKYDNYQSPFGYDYHLLNILLSGFIQGSSIMFLIYLLEYC